MAAAIDSTVTDFLAAQTFSARIMSHRSAMRRHVERNQMKFIEVNASN
jgi:hypothetical protein